MRETAKYALDYFPPRRYRFSGQGLEMTQASTLVGLSQPHSWCATVQTPPQQGAQFDKSGKADQRVGNAGYGIGQHLQQHSSGAAQVEQNKGSPQRVHSFRVDAGQDGHYSGGNSQNHHADKTHREGVPVRPHVRVCEHLMRERPVHWEERHHAAGDQQPDVRRTNKPEGPVWLRRTPENANLDGQQPCPQGHQQVSEFEPMAQWSQARASRRQR